MTKHLLAAGLAAALLQTAPAPSPFPLEEATAAQLQDWMTSGRYTARQIAQMYLDRIERVDRQGPTLRSVIEINPDALTIADALDKERAEKGPRGPLHGIPVLIKDNIDTADRMSTTAGSLALEGSHPTHDAFVVSRLREAGVVILGKTNLSEWANFRSTHSTSGWSGRGGLVKNPYALDRNACGSSSGTGAAIAASLAAIGVGTETDGSIVCPSGTNGLVGIKPTVGLVSRSGIIPISRSQDTAGPMARTVTDAALLLGAMTGVDRGDPASPASAAHAPRDYTKALDANALKGARIGVARKQYFGYSDVTDAIAEKAIADMKAAGAVIVDPANIPTASKMDSCENEVLQTEFKAGINEYLASLGPSAPRKTLADLIAFNDENKDREMPYFGQETFIESQKRGPLTNQKYVAARARCRALARTEGIDFVLRQHRLDALVAPTGGPAWTTDLVNGDHFTGASSTPAAVAGYPSITVPAGYAFGLPVGISFIGGAWSEPKLIALAYAYEQATKHRAAPRFAEHASTERDAR
ncbi:MAG TPA: amidase [Vicinamibacterales bacterium]|nr:amidase [Vicinamibacterales bacterium]